MQTIDFINGKGYKVIEFPDGELHLELKELDRKDSVNIKCRITDGNDLFLLMQLSDILKRQCMDVKRVDIYYLMGMRCDRLFDINRPFTLGIVADVVNSLNADKVVLYEPHSFRCITEIERSCYKDITQILANKLSFNKDYAFVAPDKGACVRYGSIDFSVICSKVRNSDTGELLGFTAEAQTDVKGKDLLVVDDLCDGGGTFVGLSPHLRELRPNSLSLLVTHAVQQRGIERVADCYDKVFITDTYLDWSKSDLPKNVDVIPVIE